MNAKIEIEMCGGKEEAGKFRKNNKWFQRFEKRRAISLRRTSNKKKRLCK